MAACDEKVLVSVLQSEELMFIMTIINDKKKGNAQFSRPEFFLLLIGLTNNSCHQDQLCGVVDLAALVSEWHMKQLESASPAIAYSKFFVPKNTQRDSCTS